MSVKEPQWKCNPQGARWQGRGLRVHALEADRPECKSCLHISWLCVLGWDTEPLWPLQWPYEGDTISIYRWGNWGFENVEIDPIPRCITVHLLHDGSKIQIWRVPLRLTLLSTPYNASPVVVLRTLPSDSLWVCESPLSSQGSPEKQNQ